ncbi:hypothetical protein A4G20_07815 [Pasteurellaceae bacterium RH1A]|nr:hypothetical protein A4G20_07815 [Pasteurellaceae bacterium RH1A]
MKVDKAIFLSIEIPFINWKKNRIGYITNADCAKKKRNGKMEIKVSDLKWIYIKICDNSLWELKVNIVLATSGLIFIKICKFF